MYKSAIPIYLLVESPLHAGSGSDLGYIDLPIQREKHTGYPKIESSGVKGAMRQAFEAKDQSDSYLITLQKVFGFDEDGLSNEVLKEFDTRRDFAGALGLSDARILLFPVKSLKGTFAWVTCSRVLAKFKQELESICAVEEDTLFDVPTQIGVASNKLYINPKADKKLIQLEEYIYDGLKDDIDEIKNLAEWLSNNLFDESLPYWKEKIKDNLIVLDEDDFADFVKFSTEVHTRIKIDNDTGTVKDGALFTEEYLPSETVLYSLAMFAPEFSPDGMSIEKVANFFDHNKPQYFQMGGNSSIGKGIVRLITKELPK